MRKFETTQNIIFAVSKESWEKMKKALEDEKVPLQSTEPHPLDFFRHARNVVQVSINSSY
jgi:hypothetical protein